MEYSDILVKTLTTRVEDKLAKNIDQIAKEEGINRSTIIRRFLMASVKDWQIEKNLKEYEAGKQTIRQSAEKCGISLWEAIEEAKKRKIRAPYTSEELEEDMREFL